MSSIDFSTVLAISIHDMKNSINMVLNSLEELLDTEQHTCHCDAQQISRLQYEARRVNDNLIQLLTLYRNAKGLYTPYFQPTAINELLEDVCESNRPMMEHRGIICETEFAEPLIWAVDQQLLNAVIENIINNTMRYTQNRISIAAWIDNDWLTIQVCDNGAGFPPEMLGRGIIDGEKTLNPKLGRTGLGLHFCAVVADAHQNDVQQGFIELSNQGVLGGGCFTVALPKL